MQHLLFLGAFLSVGCEYHTYVDAPTDMPGTDVPSAAPAADPAALDAGVLPATGGPGMTGEPRSAGFYGLHLQLPFPAGESRVFTRGYETGTHVDYGEPHMDDRFAIDLAGEGCSSWRAPVLAMASGVVFFNGDHGYGNNLFIDHGNGCESHHAHCDEIVVEDGEWVHQGQLVCYEGNSGSVFGSACPSHPGTHSHNVVMCHGEGVLPEPISGYWGLRGREGATLVSDNVGFARHPPGTLVKTRDSPRIYLVDDANQLRWLATEDDLHSRRLYRDSGDPFGLVVTVSAEEFSCYAHGGVFDWPVTMRITRCGDGGHYLAVDDRGDRRRWWIPGAPGGALFRTLLASWGFRESEVVDGHAGCGYPLAEASVYLRDGTIVHDGGSYAYVAHGSLSYAVRPEMLWALGFAPDDVLEIPAGSLDALTRGPDPSRPSLAWEDLSGCGGSLPPPRVPSGESDVFGGFGGGLPPVDIEASVPADAGTPSVPDAGMHVPSPVDAGLEGPPPVDAGPAERDAGWSAPDAGMPPPACVAYPEVCNDTDDDCDGRTDEDGVCAPPPPPPPPPSGHTVRIRFSGYDGSWTFTGDLIPGWVVSSAGTVDRTWSGVTDGWYRVNGQFPGPRWMCEEWPLGTFRVPYGVPEVWIDGVPAAVQIWHDPSIESPTGTGCNLRFCAGGGCI